MDEREPRNRGKWRFIRIGLIYALGGEYFVHIALRGVIDIAFFAALLVIYGLYVLLEWKVVSTVDRRAARVPGDTARARLSGTLQYWIGFTLFGFFVIEWLWLKHAGEIWLVQVSMLGFWSAVALIPAMFTDSDLPVALRLRARRRIFVLLIALGVPAVGLELVGFEGERNAALYLAFMVFTIGLQWPCLRYIHWLACGQKGRSLG